MQPRRANRPRAWPHWTKNNKLKLNGCAVL